MSATIYFLNGDTPELEGHYYEKEYRDDIVVEINKVFYEVYFFTQDSLIREFRLDGFFAMPGLIVLDVMKKETIITSIKYLLQVGFFDSFKGYDKSTILTSNFSMQYYVNKAVELSFDNAASFQIG